VYAPIRSAHADDATVTERREELTEDGPN